MVGSKTLDMDDFILTIDSDAEDVEVEQIKGKKGLSDEQAALNPDFTFDITGDPYADVLAEHATLNDIVKTGSKPVTIFFIVWFSLLTLFVDATLSRRHYRQTTS